MKNLTNVWRIGWLLMLWIPILLSCSKKNHTVIYPVTPETYKIGALLSLSGSGASTGESSQVALGFAKTDIENYLKKLGYPVTIELVIRDTGTDTVLALQWLKEFYQEEGIRLVIGPYSSAEVAALKSYADANGILLVSPSSVATSLAIPGDNIYRFVTSDIIQGEAMSKMLREDGIRVIVPVVRDDVWGNDLLHAVTHDFTSQGGAVHSPVKYNPSTTDFITLLNQLNEQVRQELETFQTAEVGVYLASFGEGTSVLHQAGNYPDLSRVMWYGSSAFAQNSGPVQDSVAGSFASAHGLPCPVYGLDEGARTKWEPLKAKIAGVTGRNPDVYALTAYDALWVGALAYHTTGANPGIDYLARVYMYTADTYYGVTGNTMLNEDGDRAYGNYDFWALKRESNQYIWKRVAVYNSSTGTLSRIVK